MRKDSIELLSGRFDFIDGSLIECKDGWFDLIWNLCEELEKQDLKSFVFQRAGGLLSIYPPQTDVDGLVMENLRERSKNKCEYCGEGGIQVKIDEESWTLCKFHAKAKKKKNNLVKCPNCEELISYSRRESSKARQRKTCPYCSKKMEIERVRKRTKVERKLPTNIIDDLDKQILDFIGDHFIASKMAKKLGINKSVISKHISKMIRLGMLKPHGGKQKYYRVVKEQISLAMKNEGIVEKPKIEESKEESNDDWAGFVTADKM